MGLLDFKNTLQQVKNDLLGKPKETLLSSPQKVFQKNSEVLNGYYYSKDGFFIGNIPGSDDTHIIETERGWIINDAVVFGHTTLKDELNKYVDKTYFSGLSHREFLIFATLCYKEEPNSSMGTMAVANAFVNYLLGSTHLGYTLNDIINKRGFSSVPLGERIPMDYKKIAVGSPEKTSIEGVCNAILYYGDVGGQDYSNGATHWDGYDLALNGKKHIKVKDQGIYATQEHLTSYLEYWSRNNYAQLKAYSGNPEATFPIEEDALISSPIKATGTYNKDRVLYKSVAQYGGTIFWGPNYDADENIGYNWKDYYKR